MSHRGCVTPFACPGSPPPSRYPCHLCWKDDTTIYIGWANHVKIGLVKRRRGHEPRPLNAQGQPIPHKPGVDLPDRYVQIVALFQVSTPCQHEQDRMMSCVACMLGDTMTRTCTCVVD